MFGVGVQDDVYGVPFSRCWSYSRLGLKTTWRPPSKLILTMPPKVFVVINVQVFWHGEFYMYCDFSLNSSENLLKYVWVFHSTNLCVAFVPFLLKHIVGISDWKLSKGLNLVFTLNQNLKYLNLYKLHFLLLFLKNQSLILSYHIKGKGICLRDFFMSMYK